MLSMPASMREVLALRVGSAVLRLLEQRWSRIEPRNNTDGMGNWWSALHQWQNTPVPCEEAEVLKQLASFWLAEVAEDPSQAVRYQDELMMLFAGDLGDIVGAEAMAQADQYARQQHWMRYPEAAMVQVLGGDFLGMIGHMGLIDLHLKEAALGWTPAHRTQVIMDQGQ